MQTSANHFTFLETMQSACCRTFLCRESLWKKRRRSSLLLHQVHQQVARGSLMGDVLGKLQDTESKRLEGFKEKEFVFEGKGGF